MAKHWDYEDDHDWGDDVDYAAKGYVYWYGNYYPKEDIDAFFKNNTDSEDENSPESGTMGWILLAHVGVFGAGYGIKMKIIPYIKRKKSNRELAVESK